MQNVEENIQDRLGLLFFSILYWSFEGLVRVIAVCEYVHTTTCVEVGLSGMLQLECATCDVSA